MRTGEIVILPQVSISFSISQKFEGETEAHELQEFDITLRCSIREQVQLIFQYFDIPYIDTSNGIVVNTRHRYENSINRYLQWQIISIKAVSTTCISIFLVFPREIEYFFSRVAATEAVRGYMAYRDNVDDCQKMN